MRRSLAALAIIEKIGPPAAWLVRWSDRWQAYSLPGGHQRPDESFRACVCREIEEELHLKEGAQFRAGFYPLVRLDFRAFSRGAGEETEYHHEAFAVELLGDAVSIVERDPLNRWVARREIAAGQADDGKPIDVQVARLLGAIEQCSNRDERSHDEDPRE